MDPHHLIFPFDSPTSGDEFVSHPQSISQDFFVPSLQTNAAGYHFLPPQQPYSSLDQIVHGRTPGPRVPGETSARSFLSAARGSVSPSISSDSSDQARLCHDADHVPALHQPSSQLLPTFTAPAPAPASGAMVPPNLVIGNRRSPHRHYSSQIPVVARGVASVPTLGSSGPQSNTVVFNPSQNMPSFMNAPPPTLSPTYHTPSSLPHTPADQADIEYAQYRYGDKRCFYQCRFDLHGSPCNKWIVGDRTRVLRHLRHHHHLQTGPTAPAVCRWAECTHTRPMKQENLSRHVVMHLGVKWKCPHCHHLFSRDDAVHRHIERKVPGMDVTDAEVIPGPEARAIIEPQFKRSRRAY